MTASFVTMLCYLPQEQGPLSFVLSMIIATSWFAAEGGSVIGVNLRLTPSSMPKRFRLRHARRTFHPALRRFVALRRKLLSK